MTRDEVEAALRRAHQRTGGTFTAWCEAPCPAGGKHKLTLTFDRDSVPCCRKCETELARREEGPVAP